MENLKVFNSLGFEINDLKKFKGKLFYLFNEINYL